MITVADVRRNLLRTLLLRLVRFKNKKNYIPMSIMSCIIHRHAQKQPEQNQTLTYPDRESNSERIALETHALTVEPRLLFELYYILAII